MISSTPIPEITEPEIIPIVIEPDPAYTIPEIYVELVTEMAVRHDVPVWLAARLISTENDIWNQRSVSPANANGTRDLGLMQHNSDNLVSFSNWYNHGRKYNPYSAKDSLDIGLSHLRWLFEEFGDWTRAVMAYNTGETRVWYGEVKAPTIAYAKKIMGNKYQPSSERPLRFRKAIKGKNIPGKAVAFKGGTARGYSDRMAMAE